MNKAPGVTLGAFVVFTSSPRMHAQARALHIDEPGRRGIEKAAHFDAERHGIV